MTEKQQGIAPNDFLSTMTDLAESIRLKDRGVAKLRTVRQRFEKQGADMPALDLCLRLQKLGPAEAELRLRNALRYSRWMGMQIGDQAQLFSDDAGLPSQKAAAAFTEAQAYEEGYRAGIGGRDATDSRFPTGTPLYERHWTGWQDGQAVLAEEMGAPLPDDGTTLTRPKKEAKTKKGATAARGKPRGRGVRRRGGAEASA
jgi:hypothetical protein